jgi:transcriptional regulator with XRE-family HTH domain
MNASFLTSSAPSSGAKQGETLPFYKLLEALEYSRSWSERDVLKRLRVPRTTYRSWRDGTSEPSKRIYWIKLSDAFGVPIEALIRGDLSLIYRRIA